MIRDFPLPDVQMIDGQRYTYTYADGGGMRLTIQGKRVPGHTRDRPWLPYAERITALQLEEGILSIGSGAFRECSNLISVQLPSSLLAIRGNAFGECAALEEITYCGSMDRLRRIKRAGGALPKHFDLEG